MYCVLDLKPSAVFVAMFVYWVGFSETFFDEYFVCDIFENSRFSETQYQDRLYHRHKYIRFLGDWFLIFPRYLIDL